MKFLSLFLLFVSSFTTVNSFSQTARGNTPVVEIRSISPLTKWEAHKIQEVHIQLLLPLNFHAYTDQFKVIDVQPQGFKTSKINVQSEIEFFDKFSKKTRRGFKDLGTITVVLEAPEIITNPNQSVRFNLRHQICSETVCYLPKNILIEAQVTTGAVAGFGLPVAGSKKSMFDFTFFDDLKNSLETNLLLSFVLVFLAGILTSFTPCIFPMLPITISILGYHANKSNRFHNFSRAVAYVLGIAITYSMLGVIAALTGSLFGAALSNKFVVIAMCILFVTMAFSMWGAFEIQVPAFIRNRFGSGHSHGLGGAFVMGLVAGIVASPCVGPVLVSILSFVSTTHDVVLGFSLLFTFALGLGMIFLVIGLFSHALHLLPKSGPWLDFVKFVLGAGMWVTALYYSQFVVSHRWWVALVAASFVALATWKGAFKFRSKNYLKQSLLLTIFIFSTTVLLLSFVRPQYLSPAFQSTSDGEYRQSKTQWTPFSEAELQKAIAEEKPVFLDFFAEWCAACHELEEKTYTNDEFVELAKHFKLIKLDATEDSAANQQILKKYGVQGLPTVMFINKKGVPMTHLTFTQFLEWKDLKPRMQEALK